MGHIGMAIVCHDHTRKSVHSIILIISEIRQALIAPRDFLKAMLPKFLPGSKRNAIAYASMETIQFRHDIIININQRLICIKLKLCIQSSLINTSRRIKGKKPNHNHII